MSAVDVTLLLVHAGATLAMVGLIWFVQVVHYPLAAAHGHCAYAQHHVDRTGRVVGPFMLAEALTAVTLALHPPAPVPAWLPWTGAVLLAGIWLSTALLQMPAHGRLVVRFDRDTATGLVRSNWIRTVLWTARGVLALGAIAAVL